MTRLTPTVRHERAGRLPPRRSRDDPRPDTRSPIQRCTTHLRKEIRIAMRSAQPWQMDGDLIEEGNQPTVQIEPAALLLRVPTGS
jgi:hypothetical protein